MLHGIIHARLSWKFPSIQLICLNIWFQYQNLLIRVKLELYYQIQYVAYSTTRTTEISKKKTFFQCVCADSDKIFNKKKHKDKEAQRDKRVKQKQKKSHWETQYSSPHSSIFFGHIFSRHASGRSLFIIITVTVDLLLT